MRKADCTCTVVPQAGAEGRAVRPPDRPAAGLRRAGGEAGRRRDDAVTVETRTFSPPRRRRRGRRPGLAGARQRLKVRWGRAGQPLRLQTLRFNTEDDARAAYFARVAELDAKGYLDAIGGVRRVTARHEARTAGRVESTRTSARIAGPCSLDSLSTMTHHDHARTDPLTLWRQIDQAGGIQAYVDAQLRERGFLVERRDADDDVRPRAGPVQEVAQGRGRGAAEARAARRGRRTRPPTSSTSARASTGPTTRKPDKWDLPNAEERAAENELPPLDSPQQLAEALGLTVAAAPLAGLPPRRGDDASTTAASPSPSATAPSGRSGRRCRGSRRPSAGSCATSSSGCRSTARPTASWPAARSLTNAAVHTEPEDRPEDGHQGLLPDRHAAAGEGRLPQGRLPRAGRDAAGAALHRVAARGRASTTGKTYYVALGPRCLPQGAPTSPALTNTLCLRLDRRLTGLAPEARLALHPLRRRPDLQPAGRPPGPAAARGAARAA